jgi:hypothetical protein
MGMKQADGVWFSWDDEKSERNHRRREFDFEAAVDAFFDEFALGGPNMDWSGEERYELIGRIPNTGIIVVVYTVWNFEDQDEELYRIISARRANKSERAKYDKGINKQ